MSLWKCESRSALIVSVRGKQEMDFKILQLALLVVKHLVEDLFIFVDLFALAVNPAVVFVLEAINDQQHLLAFKTTLVFFLFGRALIVYFFSIGSALG
jgi:hypothetical protein